MKIRIYLITLILIFLNTCDLKQRDGDDLTLTAEVINVGFSEDISKISKYLDVKIKVSNLTSAPQSFWIMKCSWQESFRTDKEDITLSPRECVGNFPIQVTLRPDSFLEFLTMIRIPEQAFVNDSFKIGLVMVDKEYFEVNLLRDKETNNKYLSNQKTFWSNSISLDENPMGYDLKKAYH